MNRKELHQLIKTRFHCTKKKAMEIMECEIELYNLRYFLNQNADDGLLATCEKHRNATLLKQERLQKEYALWKEKWKSLTKKEK